MSLNNFIAIVYTALLIFSAQQLNNVAKACGWAADRCLSRVRTLQAELRRELL
jgi:hypothetical protein